ncbi:MAG: transcription antitermination factor NusB, partial [Pseudomonadota bacterium]
EIHHLSTLSSFEQLLNKSSARAILEHHDVLLTKKLFKNLSLGAWKLRKKIDLIVDQKAYQHFKNRQPELLLRLILRLGAFELIERQQIKPAIVISAWLDIANFYFAQKEIGLINAILDALSDELSKINVSQ